MEVSVELVSTCPNRRHASVGQGFPRASQTHAVTLFRLQELEILGATERENMIVKEELDGLCSVKYVCHFNNNTKNVSVKPC